MKKIVFTAVVLLSILSLNAQFAYDYLKAADEYFYKKDYYSAALYYEKYLAAGGKALQQVYKPYTVSKLVKKAVVPVSNKEQAIYNTAEAYRLLNYYEKSEPHYAQLAGMELSKFPGGYYWYGVTQRALGKYEEAEKSFTLFVAGGTENEYTEAAKKEIANLQFIQTQLKKKDLKYYTVAPAGTMDTGAFYAPVWVDGSTVMFTSTKPDAGAAKNAVFTNRVYSAGYANGVFSPAEKIAIAQPKDMHQGTVSFTADGNTMFLTRWNDDGKNKTSAIYSSTKNADGWSEPVMLDVAVNTVSSNSQQPFVNGKQLFYASDKPGGLGGFDLWIADLDASGKPTASVNAGDAINTKWNEQAPYYHNASKTLVFSTNGRVGMGGYDFFFTNGEAGTWAAPKNFGYPVNSVKDDLYFASRGSAKNILEDVLFSSDRAAACCLQLFSLKKIIPVKNIIGVVVACDTKLPIGGATLTIVDETNNQTLFTKTTDASGRYSIVLDEFQPLKVMATTSGYHPGTLNFNAPEINEATVLENPDLCLAKIPVAGTVEVLDNVYFEFNKAVVLDESHASLNRLVKLMNDNPNAVIEISGHTDSKGNDSYNQKLSEARAQSVVEYLLSQGIERSRLTAKGYGEAKPIAPNVNDDGTDNHAGREKNRRTEFKVLKNEVEN